MISPDNLILYLPFVLTIIMYVILNKFFYRYIVNNWFEPFKGYYFNFGIILIISLLLSFEFFIFGTNSLIVIYDEGDTFFPLYKVLAENTNSEILFSFSGGLFKNGVMFDTKFISLQILLIKILDPFWGYATIKFLNAFLIVVGFYLITKRNIKETVILSFIYYGSLTYISTISIAHMSGYSSIPLTIYLLYQYKDQSYLRKTLVLTMYFSMISISSTLPHSIMAHIGAILSGLFLYEIKYKNIMFCLKGILLISILSLLNHFPTIEFTLNNKDLLFRTSQNVQNINYYDLFLHPILEFRSKLRGSLIFGIGIILIMYFSLIYKNKIKTISIILPFVLSISLDLLLTIDIFSFMRSLRSEMIILCLPSIVIICFYQFFKTKKNNIPFIQKNQFKYIILLTFSYFVCDTKFTHFLHWQGEGSFKSNFILNKNLKSFLEEHQIYSKSTSKNFSNFRNVVVPTKLTPAILWYHQINSFDGYSSFFPKKRAEKWMNVFQIPAHNEQYIMDRYYLKFTNLNLNKSFTNDKKISFLRTHGVRYYFSSILLNEPNLKLVYKKSFKEKTNNYFQIQMSNFKRNLQNMDFNVYEDVQYNPMIYVSDSKTKFLCQKEIKINKEENHLSLNFMRCPVLDKPKLSFLTLSLPNFEEIEVKQGNIKSRYKINKELLFKIPIQTLNKKITIKPIIKEFNSLI